MWDWELLKNGSGKHQYEILTRYGNEDCQYTHATSFGSEEDVFFVHNHAMYELVYCLEGDAVYIVEGKKYVLQPNSLLVICPTIPHKLFICSQKPFERHILYLYTTGSDSGIYHKLSKYKQSRQLADKGSLYFENDKDHRFLNLLQMIEKASSSNEEAMRELTPYYVQAFTATLLMSIQEDMPEQYSVSTGKSINILMEYLNANYTSNLNLTDIANRFSFSKDYCNRIFRKTTGMTVMQYINYNRILLARKLLNDGVHPVDAATQSGFQDYSTFYRTYKKVTGRTPQKDYQSAEVILELPSFSGNSQNE